VPAEESLSRNADRLRRPFADLDLHTLLSPQQPASWLPEIARV